MLSVVKTATICGLEPTLVEVEVDVAAKSFPAFTLVGLPGKSVDEAKERVRSALQNSNCEFPQHRITVNLAPADLPKNGPTFDVAIALGLLLASEQINCSMEGAIFFGELSLDGSLRPINGALAMATLAKRIGATIYLPAANAVEAAVVDGVTVIGFETLQQLVLHLTGVAPLQPQPLTILEAKEDQTLIDMAEILGQEQSKRGLEIAAAGGHNMLLEGLPGSGKTLLARAFPGILPRLTATESLEVSTIHSISGLLGNQAMLTSRPFRSPHHTTSSIGMIGGGTYPRPGEVSLSHRGVLFLDEFAEFPRSVLEVLRQPLEDGVVTVSRAKASYVFPAQFQLLAAQNPCPCGHLGDPRRSCTCTPHQIATYAKRVSGPILDRIDLFVQVPRVEERHFSTMGQRQAESSASIRQRVQQARDRQLQRFSEEGIVCNAYMPMSATKRHCRLGSAEVSLMDMASRKLQLSARSYFRVIKVARTIADLEGAEELTTAHLSEALQYRKSD